MFLNAGINDSAQGTLLLYMGLSDDIGYTLVDPPAYPGIGHGATIVPLFPTSLGSHGMQWFPVCSFGIAVSAINGVESEWTLSGIQKSHSGRCYSPYTAPSQPLTPRRETESMLKDRLRSKVTRIEALLIFGYQVTEVAMPE